MWFYIGILISVISVILGVCFVVILLVCITGLAYWKVKMS